MQKSINQVVADNLHHWMKQRGIRSQMDLANKSGVSQRTVANYLKPQLRQSSSSGKEPSAKLIELEKLANALDVEVWQLLRQLTPEEWNVYHSIEASFLALLASAKTPSSPH